MIGTHLKTDFQGIGEKSLRDLKIWVILEFLEVKIKGLLRHLMNNSLEGQNLKVELGGVELTERMLIKSMETI